MYKLKIISSEKKTKLENEVNRFLKKIKEKLFDIKFTHTYVRQFDIHMYLPQIQKMAFQPVKKRKKSNLVIILINNAI